ncbi:YIP1 family protein [Roseicitreum antarcticum]|uniref:Yip1 domain-containing protein n=1 Tax=Roseicitreum antarcticum TaxID=564137 RepID=A0A1H3D710_9RHOB|nr:YIP1 family protein [Roseicitreum antarcticum]SDX62147.1 hypothetical protein SAMN04488238_11219 [Roseicitreum antarcticum]
MALTFDILRMYRTPRAVVRGLLAQGQREDRALMFIMLFGVLNFVAQLPRVQRAAYLDPEMVFQQEMGGVLFASIFVVPLLAYGFAALLHLGLRAFRRPSTWFTARLVLFWSLLSVAPLSLIQGMLQGFNGVGGVGAIFGLGVAAVFLWFLIAGFREAALETAGTRI